MTDDDPGAARCAVHPARPAADDCPVCGRPRCAPDAAAAPGGGCVACQGRSDAAGPPPVDLRALAGAAVAAHLTSIVGGVVCSEYVDVTFFEIVVPAVLGIACGAAAEFGARRARGWQLRALAVLYALLGTALAYVAVPGPGSPFTPLADVVPSYAGAVLGAWLWTAPPRRRRPAE